MRAIGFLFCLLSVGASAGAQSPSLGAVVNRSGVMITGVTFRVWAPNATSVAVRGEFSGWAERAMTKDSTTGYWTVTVAEALLPPPSVAVTSSAKLLCCGFS